MVRYLIDVNLPYHFSLWNSPDYQHQRDINDEWSDSQIWQYAVQHNLTIVTKDTDFSNRIMLREPPPRVIWIGFGNLKMRPFYERMVVCWSDVLALSEQCKLIRVYLDRIETVQ